MKTKNEDIIKKLFESKCSLSPEERAALNNYEYEWKKQEYLERDKKLQDIAGIRIVQ